MYYMMYKNEFVDYLLNYTFPEMSTVEFCRLFDLIDKAQFDIPKICGIFSVPDCGCFLPINVEGKHALIETQNAVIFTYDLTKEMFGDELANKFGNELYIGDRLSPKDILEFEEALRTCFEHFYFNGERWILQKKRKPEYFRVPEGQLNPFSYQYHIRRESQINKFELYGYYVASLNKTGGIEIDCENDFVGRGPLYGERHYLKVDSFYLSNNNKFSEKEIKEFFLHLLSKFNPSIFSQT